MHDHPRQPPRHRARDVAGAASATASTAATRNVELRRLLALAARRRLKRLQSRMAAGGSAGTQRGDAEPTTAAANTATVTDEPAAATSGAAAVPDPANGQPGPATKPALLRRTPVTPGLLQLEVTRPAGFHYRPGQHVKMGLPGLLRTFSLVSAPHEPTLEFFVELFPGGRLSERLRTLPEGSEMAVGDRAKGSLAVDPRQPNQLLVATVTGIAPYLSMLRHETRSQAPARRFVVLHGASFADELGYADELTELARRYPDRVHYEPTVSRPEDPRNAAWRGLTGRVEAQLEALLQRFGLEPANTAAFACGNPGMVSNLAGTLGGRGFPVQTEPFD